MPPTTNLQPGMTGPEVQKLQNYLLSKGLLTQAQINTGYGVYGPATTAAVKALQNEYGVDNSSGPGVWGPKTRAAVTGGGVSGAAPYTAEQYNAALKENPIVSQYIKQGNTAEDLDYATSTGDFSQLKNAYGQPFSIEEQQAALKQAEEDNKAYFEQLKAKETADTEATLAQKAADYQDYLANAAIDFGTDKTTLDQSAANTGVLFSGGRVQKEKALQSKYAQDQASKQATVGRDIASTARDYQYKYGNEPASSLSQYYKLGSNVYNPNVATGGATSGGLSSIYNPSATTYGGTRIAEQATAANKRASGLLANKANKLLSTGYLNKL